MNEMTQQIDNLLQDSNNFRNWLEQWSEEAIIGEASNCNDCPISNFVLGSVFTVDDDISVIVGSQVLNVVDDQYETIVLYDLPVWVTSFINSIDEIEGYVTVRECLDTLEGIL